MIGKGLRVNYGNLELRITGTGWFGRPVCVSRGMAFCKGHLKVSKLIFPIHS